MYRLPTPLHPREIEGQENTSDDVFYDMTRMNLVWLVANVLAVP